MAINRTNKKNIVVSWDELTVVGSQLSFQPTAAYSNDGGKTWTTVLIPVIGLAEDCRGVTADKYGNFLYCINERLPTPISPNPGPLVIEATFFASSNGEQVGPRFIKPMFPLLLRGLCK